MTSIKLVACCLALVSCSVFTCHAGEGAVETFSGNGQFSSSSSGDILHGFDLPDWRYRGDGMFRDGGLWVENSRMLPDVGDVLVRSMEWSNHFVTTLAIREHVLTEEDLGNALIVFGQAFGEGTNQLSVSVNPNNDEDGRYDAVAKAGRIQERRTVEQGPHIFLSTAFDQSTSQAVYLYDNNLDDEVPPITLATLDYSGVISEQVLTRITLSKTDSSQVDGLIDHWSFSPFFFPGDFNENGIFDGNDIDLLNAEIRRGTNDPAFDLVEDGIVNQFDRNFWVHNINNTYFGDADLDREFNSGDLVAVFQSGHYEDGVAMNSGWAEGDWNGNADFESGDLIVAFQDRGYEVGPRVVANAVPEPASFVMLMAGLIALQWCRRKVVLISRTL